MNLLALIGIMLPVGFLTYGSYSDIKTRQVSDTLWLIVAPFSAALMVLRLYLNPASILLTALSVMVSCLASYGFFLLGLYGGADAKAMICLSFVMPLPPATVLSLAETYHPFFPLAILYNSFLYASGLSFAMLFKNLATGLSSERRLFEGLEDESIFRKLLTLVSGLRMSFDRLETTRFLFPLEYCENRDGRKRRRLRLTPDVDGDAKSQIAGLRKEFGGGGEIWVTPGIPMLIFINASFISCLILGDPLLRLEFHILNLILGR